MSRTDRATFLLAGLMVAAGGAAFFLSAYLPPLLELRALRVEYENTRARVAELEERLLRVSKQMEHMRDDPAYWERLMRKEFGTTTPGVQGLPVDVRPNPVESVAAGPVQPERVFDLDLEEVVWNHPFLAVFVLDETRPLVMAISGVVVLTSIFIMFRSGARRSSRSAGDE